MGEFLKTSCAVVLLPIKFMRSFYIFFVTTIKNVYIMWSRIHKENAWNYINP